MRKRRTASVTLLVIVLIASNAMAQATRGGIQGTVKDTSGAVIVGARVLATNVNTGVHQETTTNADGLYYFPSVLPGTYDVQVSLPGFTTAVLKGIGVTVGQTVVGNVDLQPGSVSTTVTVSGAPPLVESTNATLSNIVIGTKIQDLPLNGRDFTRLAELQPGVVFNASGSRSAFGGKEANFLVNGQIDQSTLFLLDGSDISDQTFGYSPKDASGQLLGLDAIQEFRLLSSNYSAEFGRNPGGVVEAVSRSGSNEFHGSVYEFLRNSSLDAKNFFDLPNKEIPQFKRNQFGGRFGGPLRKDSTFFFVNYEGLRERLGVTSVSTVPNALARQGQLPDPNNPGQFITVPVNPAVVPFLDLYPLPNGPDRGDGTATFTTSASQATTSDLGVARVDTRLGPKDSLFGRLMIDRSDAVQPFGSVPVPGFPSSVDHNFLFIILQETKAISNNLINVSSFGFNRTDQKVTLPPPPPNVPSIALISGRPLGLVQVAGLSSLGNQTIFPIGGVQNLFQAQDQLSWSHGRHQIKTGFEVRRYQVNDFFDLTVNGQFTFNGLAQFLRGSPTNFLGVQAGSSSDRGWRWVSYGAFIQDDFQIRHNLTINLGLRYEYNTVPTDVRDRISNLRFPSDPAVTVGGLLFNNINTLFDPRFGFAWMPIPRTVVRGGFGIFRDQIIVNVFGNTRLSPPFLVGAFAANPSFPNAAAGNLRAIILSVQNLFFGVQQPTVEQWNLQVQHQLTSTTVVKAAYVGNRGLHLVRSLEANTAIPTTLADGTKFFPPGVKRRNPNFGPIRERKTDGLSWYNALQLEADQRLYQGLILQGSYTFSRTTNTNGSSFTNFPNNPGNAQDPESLSDDKALAPFHQKHHLVINSLYQIPVGRGRRYLGNANGLVEHLLGGWRVGGIFTYASGEPFTVTVGFNRSNSLQTGTVNADRPNVNPNFTGPVILGDPKQFFDPNAFVLQPVGFFGNVGRNTLIGPDFRQLDMTLAKVFRVTESSNLEFRADFFNLPNHPNFATPSNTTAFQVGGGDTVFGDTSGKPVGNAGQIFSTVTTSRQIQFSLRFSF